MDNYNVNYDVNDEVWQQYFQREILQEQNRRALGLLPNAQEQQLLGGNWNQEPIVVDPALEQFPANFFFGDQAMNNPVVAPQVEQNIEAAPVVHQEPIAQGIQHNGAFGVVFPEPAFNLIPIPANQIPNIVPAADPPKVEQVPDFEHDIESASEDENDVDAEGEPAGLQDPAGLPKPTPMTPEAAEAIVRVRSLATDRLTQAVAQFQDELKRRADNVMAGQEMDIDQPEQLDGIPAFANDDLFGANAAQNTQDNDNESGRTIHDITPPDHNSTESRNNYLLTCRRLGASYSDIKTLGGFTEAESTLRGRYRTLTKAPEARLRKPVWTQKDVDILRNVTYEWYRDNKKDFQVRPPWKLLTERMVTRGASYHYGSGTASKVWQRIHALDKANLEAGAASAGA